MYVLTSADQVYKGTEPAEVSITQAMTLQLLTLSAGVDAPFGTSLLAVMPLAHMVYSFHNPVDLEPEPDKTYDEAGDLEIRARQDLGTFLPQPSWLRYGAGLGVVMPTGSYVKGRTEQSVIVGQVLDTRSKELSIGRGAWWLVADLDAAVLLGERVALLGNTSLRVPQNLASDGFGWGRELRGNLGARVRILDMLSAGVSGELQHRTPSTQPTDIVDEFGMPTGRTVQGEAPNSGGRWAYVTPNVQVTPLAWLALSASVRLPVWRDVIGEQIVQNAAFFVSLTGTLGVGGTTEAKAVLGPTPLGQEPQQPEIAAMVAAGKLTLVDYWATWCAPCLQLTPLLEKAVEGKPGVVLQRVDATEWGPAEWKRFLPDASGLPVVDVYGPDRRLRARLVGDKAFEAVQYLPADASPVAP